MVTMTHCGITITVYPADVEFYKSAGYVVVMPEKLPAPTESEAITEPVKKTAKK